MKIYKANVDEKFRPSQQNFIWPPQNAKPGGDYGVEQDFSNWLYEHHHLMTEFPRLADFIYIPIYWNRYYINTLDENNQWGGGLEELAEEVESLHKYKAPMFTIAEADVKWLKPIINWKNIIVFCASRRDENGGIDIPLLSASHDLPVEIPEKYWLASFLGHMKTDAVRQEMYDALARRKDCRIEHANYGSEEFVKTMLASYIALCPRGQGAQSFRMYEAMQLGTVPLYISDLDCRPFKKWIDWEVCSLYAPEVNGLDDYLQIMSENQNMLVEMGREALRVYNDNLAYGKWCRYIPQILREL